MIGILYKLKCGTLMMLMWHNVIAQIEFSGHFFRVGLWVIKSLEMHSFFHFQIWHLRLYSFLSDLPSILFFQYQCDDRNIIARFLGRSSQNFW